MAQSSGPVKVAAFDIGSNSIKMSVATVAEGGTVTEGTSALRTVRLGEGVDRTGRLASDRMAAAFEAIDELAEQARSEGAGTMIGVATEAVRVASNGADFLDDLTRRTGISISVITGDQEAALTYAGLATMRTLSGPVVMIDIGGASTEVVAGDGPDVVQATSIPLGSGRLTDAWVEDDPPTTQQLAAARAAAGALLDPLNLPRHRGSKLIISGGTGTYLGQFLGQAELLQAPDVERALERMTTRCGPGCCPPG
jgi:exopolyphosphatase/guanosine-5'-triphosphate,3'-diphosphate pyrophosphatase